MKRIKFHCCYRLLRGRRAGMMCRETIDPRMVGVPKMPGKPDTSDYCIRHAILVLDRWAREAATRRKADEDK